MRGITRSFSQIELIRPNVQSKGGTKNAMQQHELLAKLKHVKNTARESFITQPYDETLARGALRSEIQLGVPDKLHNASLTYNGTRARDLIGFISEQVKEHGTPADKAKLDSVSNKLANLAGREKDEKKIAGQLDELVSKFARGAGEKFINNFMETYCYPAWLKYHESQGIDVKDKEASNEQLNACSTVLNRRLDVMSEPGKPWELLAQNMSMLIDECAAVSKALIRHDFDAPHADAEPEKPVATPEALKATPDGRRYDIHGGADKGGVTLHINNSNSNRNGDISNAPVYPGDHSAAIDPHTRRLEIVEKLNISPSEKYDLARRVIEGGYGSRVIDHIESVRGDNQEDVTEQPPLIPPFAQPADDVDSQRTGARMQDPDERIPDPARIVSTPVQETPPPVEESRTRPQDEQPSPAAMRSVATQTPATRSAGEIKTTQIYTTARTLNQWSRRDPVKVHHFAPMNKPVEAPPNLRPVNGQGLAVSPTPGQTAAQPPVDELMMSTNDVLRAGATVRQAVKVASSYLPEPSVAELVTLGDVGQGDPSVTSSVDEADGRVQNAARRGARETGDVRETRPEELGVEQQTAEAGASCIPSPPVNAANQFSIADRIRYFEEAQKAGAQPASASLSRPTSSTALGFVYSTIRTRSQWDFDVPEPKSFVPRNTDALAYVSAGHGDATIGSVTNSNPAREKGDE